MILEDASKYPLNPHQRQNDALISRYPAGLAFYINEETGKLLTKTFVIPTRSESFDSIVPKHDETALFLASDETSFRYTFVKKEFQDQEIEGPE
jgi:hypothetical protein